MERRLKRQARPSQWPAALAALALLATATAAQPFYARDGGRLPFADAAGALEFLRSARVVRCEPMTGGTDRKKLLVELEQDGVAARAVHRFGDRFEPAAPHGGFVDSYRSELAAYGMDRLLALDRVAPVVERRVCGRRGALQLWIEQAMTEAERLERGIEPPDAAAFDRQLQLMHLFDNLIQNIDRNPGNMLVDRDWRVWLIDHTRAFAGLRELKYPEQLGGCERRLWRRLRGLEEQQLRRAVHRRVRYPDALVARWRRLVAVIERRLADGETDLLW